MRRHVRTSILFILAVSLVLGSALRVLTATELERNESRNDPEASPARRIERGEPAPRPPRDSDDSVRSIDGSGNNEHDPEMGATHTALRRALPPDYGDGISTLAGAHRPGPREVSNAVCAQTESMPNVLGASDYLWQWGQFLDHDLDLTDGTLPPEPAPIAIPTGDPWFDPNGDGDVVLPFNRSIYDPLSGIDTPRQQLNEITAWIDASNVYGSNTVRQAALRTLDGTGRLKMDDGLLPRNVDGLPNAGGPSPELFLAGDVRANEQVGLTAMHTLFVREHNRLAAEIADRDRHLDGDEIYERARRIVGAQMQVITYEEYLPALLGPDALRDYRGYDRHVDASITNVFSTSAYRYGHSALSPTLLRLDADGNEIAAGHLPLRDAFFDPSRITDEGGIEPLLRGLAAQECQAVDVFVIDDVRNFLFGAPSDGGFDLASLNIQRGRDHGLPSYNDARAGFGLPPAQGFSDISSNPVIRDRLASIYATVDDVDVWVGGLAEDPLPDSHVGPLIHRIVVQQFEALRDGDRFWYEEALTRRERRQVENTKLSDIIRRNTTIEDEIPDDVFRVPGAAAASTTVQSSSKSGDDAEPAQAASNRLEVSTAASTPSLASTVIQLQLPSAANVSLRIYDVRGRLVRTLVDRTLTAGETSITWDGRTDRGSEVSAGTYYYLVEAADHRATGKLLYVR